MSLSTIRLYRERAPRLTSDNYKCCHTWDSAGNTDPTSREWAAAAEIKHGTSKPTVARSTDWAFTPPRVTERGRWREIKSRQQQDLKHSCVNYPTSSIPDPWRTWLYHTHCRKSQYIDRSQRLHTQHRLSSSLCWHCGESLTCAFMLRKLKPPISTAHSLKKKIFPLASQLIIVLHHQIFTSDLTALEITLTKSVGNSLPNAKLVNGLHFYLLTFHCPDRDHDFAGTRLTSLFIPQIY